ncbi:hypothetical protein VNO78_10244 [Psophocarpus tetragonolobus]|uniref:Uncharacterized protein n=1 Tax=Psophocarpus tetragonolobus TaxID=3891 RepID=A0AAN9XMK8_PSOTE
MILIVPFDASCLLNTIQMDLVSTHRKLQIDISYIYRILGFGRDKEGGCFKILMRRDIPGKIIKSLNLQEPTGFVILYCVPPEH